MKLLQMLCAGAVGSLLLSGCCNPCGYREPIRPIGNTCLPTGTSPADIPLFRGDVDAKYTQLATIDSFVCSQCNIEDGVEPEVVQAMMRDLQDKARAVGADAVIRVKMLSNLAAGFKENPRTPFFSVMQGEWRQPFFRGIAIKYDCPPAAEPRVVPEKPLGPPPVMPQDRFVPRTAGTLPIDPYAVPQPVFPQAEAPRR